MHKLKAYLIISALAMLVNTSVVIGAPPGIAQFSVYVFAGFSTETTDGDTGGFSGMNAICQAEFGAGARMCTTKEWFDTHGTHKPQEFHGAWMQPVIVAAAQRPDVDNSLLWADFTGSLITHHTQSQGSNPRGTCNGWTRNTSLFRGFGVLYDESEGGELVGQFSCDEDFHVTCCTTAGPPSN